MLGKILKGLAVLLGIGLLGVTVCSLMIVSAMGGFDKDYSVTDLKDEFENNKTEIYELKRYFNEIVPKNKFVEIEFEDNNTLTRFGIRSLNSSSGNSSEPLFLEWDLKVNTSRVDSITKRLGWTRQTMEELKDKLDDADCIKIENRVPGKGNPVRIGFKRSGMGMYSFNVFDYPLTEEEKVKYDDSCMHIIANDKLVLEYGGGAVGAQCFYNLN